jgi:hypothetical protein
MSNEAQADNGTEIPDEVDPLAGIDPLGKDEIPAPEAQTVFHLTEEQKAHANKLSEGEREFRELMSQAARMAKENHRKLWDYLTECFPETEGRACGYNGEEGIVRIEEEHGGFPGGLGAMLAGLGGEG